MKSFVIICTALLISSTARAQQNIQQQKNRLEQENTKSNGSLNCSINGVPFTANPWNAYILNKVLYIEARGLTAEKDKEIVLEINLENRPVPLQVIYKEPTGFDAPDFQATYRTQGISKPYYVIQSGKATVHALQGNEGMIKGSFEFKAKKFDPGDITKKFQEPEMAITKGTFEIKSYRNISY